MIENVRTFQSALKSLNKVRPMLRNGEYSWQNVVATAQERLKADHGVSRLPIEFVHITSSSAH
jgi:hypothetical protein